MVGGPESGGDADEDDLVARVRRLEERLSAVEGAEPSGPGDVQSRPDLGVLDAEKFWALRGLKARAGERGAVLFTGSVWLPTGEAAEWQQGATTESLLDGDWDGLADVLAALGHPVRLLLVREVLRGTRTVAELGNVEGLGTSGQVYHHVRQLVAAGWLRSTGRGRYEVPAARVVPLLATVAAAQR
ncbi:MAG: ArsR/SmtB family transcription factor [Actinomycetes bacterium]